jgi:hypothetical protein
LGAKINYFGNVLSWNQQATLGGPSYVIAAEELKAFATVPLEVIDGGLAAHVVYVPFRHIAS